MNFDDIRPFNDSEIPAAVKQLVEDSMFTHLASKLYPQPEVKEKVFQQMSQIKTVEEFQVKIIVPLLNQIEQQTTQGITYSAMEQFHPEESYLFISNHRDIILDSAFLNFIMHRNGFNKTENAIGDNLLAFDWIKTLARINRAFIVKRGLSIREQLTESQKLSAYIRHSISEKEKPVWIAQKEGRSKDGNDATQVALLKMLDMSNKDTLTEGFKKLNIVPMAISYEIEPCGFAKIEELLNKKHNPDFKKSQQDDLSAMGNGVMKPKGRVHFAFGNPVNLKVEELTADKSKNEALRAIAEYIDKRIYYNYKMWPNNYIAYDLLNKTSKYVEHYTPEEKVSFQDFMNKGLSEMKFDLSESTDMYLRMYANPLINFEKHFQ